MEGIPNPKDVFPNAYGTSCFLKNVVTSPNVIVGDYTYYDDATDPTGFEKNNILFHYPEFTPNLEISSSLESFAPLPPAPSLLWGRQTTASAA